MGHSGFHFARRSYHTLNKTVCPRDAYLAQEVGLMRRSRELDEGPMATGKVFHSIMEVVYTPPKYRGKPLLGTDGHPCLSTPEEVMDWYEKITAPKSLNDAWDGWLKYKMMRGDDRDIHNRLVWRPEPDVVGDVRNAMPAAMAHRFRKSNGQYAAQFDAIIRHPHRKAVISVEHKLLASFTASTLALYRDSGQLVGQCLIWNSRPDLVERWGPMESVLLNLTFKGDSGAGVHREDVAIPLSQQWAYARVVCEANDDIDRRRERQRQARSINLSPAHRAAVIDKIWPQSGMIRGQCTGLISSCQFAEACRRGSVEPELYQITEEGREIALFDGAVPIMPHVRTYVAPGV